VGGHESLPEVERKNSVQSRVGERRGIAANGCRPVSAPHSSNRT
jgi:hypothetical protein